MQSNSNSWYEILCFIILLKNCFNNACKKWQIFRLLQNKINLQSKIRVIINLALAKKNIIPFYQRIIKCSKILKTFLNKINKNNNNNKILDNTHQQTILLEMDLFPAFLVFQVWVKQEQKTLLWKCLEGLRKTYLVEINQNKIMHWET